MRMWIIYTKRYETNATYSPTMMKDAALKANIDADIYFSDYFNVVIKDNQEILFYKDKEITEYPDIAFFRCSAFELMEHLDNRKVKLVNSYKGMISVRDKFKTHQILNQLKVKQPKTISSKYPDFNLLAEELGIPFVMKDNTGLKGKNVYLIDNEEEMRNLMSSNEKIKFIFQEYIKFSKGKDIRLYIVGDEVVGSITRISQTGDFRANVSLGGIGKEIKVPLKLKKEAIMIAKKLGLSICSVDYLYDENNYIFCEANGNAAFSAFIKLGYKMQDIFIEYIKAKYS